MKTDKKNHQKQQKQRKIVTKINKIVTNQLTKQTTDNVSDDAKPCLVALSSFFDIWDFGTYDWE